MEHIAENEGGHGVGGGGNMVQGGHRGQLQLQLVGGGERVLPELEGGGGGKQHPGMEDGSGTVLGTRGGVHDGGAIREGCRGDR